MFSPGPFQQHLQTAYVMAMAFGLPATGKKQASRGSLDCTLRGDDVHLHAVGPPALGPVGMRRYILGFMSLRFGKW